ncbi:glycosyltransferase [Galbitalea sp. SE-J8]|uniref:glycosyltransferase n=1 Tax=Galbitalea sp. SE-J8 TaxID=3054952 RepID=UPI00259C98B7|nr:glycosyltransferase [Galbitalea sp. SE-J8]MDM4762716.1 glycosyltransferase [Galbitalea sp. SE-J8]
MPVTAILVARNGADQLPLTLDALARQTRQPDAIVLVDDASTDATASVLGPARATQIVAIDSPRPYAQALSQALREAVPPGGADDWLWLLSHDSAPQAGALAALVAAVEVAPSVAVAGPKVMRWDARDVIAAYGATVSRLGATVPLVVDELDQAQHDRRSDVLAVGREGMLVRRSVYAELGGFDPALPTVDAALDFCIRVRLAGHRIVGVPTARVTRATAPEGWGRTAPVGDAVAARAARAAQLHRRLVAAPPLAVPLHWLSLVPLAIVRSLALLLRKQPGLVTAEFRAALGALADARVPAARRNLARGKRLRWSAIAPFRMPPAEVRRLRSQQRDLHASPVLDSTERVRAGFFAAGGAWIVLFLLAAGALVLARFLGAPALDGGGLAPLSTRVADLWASVGVGYQPIGTGFVGASDPFAFVLAILGSIAFWSPSSAIVALYVLALPLAGLGAWWFAARLSSRGWAPAAAALAWALAPPLLADLSTGHLGAVIAHLTLPWLLLALIGAARSWSASGVAAILFALVGACAPPIIPLLLVLWIVCLVANPRGVHRYMGLPIPLAVLFTPLVIDQGLRGSWLALLADPGVPSDSGGSSALQLLLGSPSGGTDGAAALVDALGLPGLAAPIAMAVLFAPLVVLALVALAHPRGGRSIPALLLALGGYLSAVLASHVAVTVVEDQVTTLWPGTALSVYWLGLVAASVVALDALGARAALATVVLAATSLLAAVPASVALVSGSTAVQASGGAHLPAYVGAEAAAKPWLRTLVLTPLADGSLAADVEHGAGTALEDESTIWATATRLSSDRAALAELAANLASRSGFDVAAALAANDIAFIVVRRGAADEGAVTRDRAIEALDADAQLTAVGATAGGQLWFAPAVAGERGPTVHPGSSPFRELVLVADGLVFGVVLLLAIPTSRRRRSTVAPTADEVALAGTGDDDE